MAGLPCPCRWRLRPSPHLAAHGTAQVVGQAAPGTLWLPSAVLGVIAVLLAAGLWACWRALRRARAEQAAMRARLRHLPHVAHDLNNALVGVLGNAEILVERGELDAPSRACAHEMREAGERARTLCRALAAGVDEVAGPVGGAPSAATALVVVSASGIGHTTRRALAGLGFEVAAAAPAEALAIVRRLPPDLVLLDVSGTDRHGIELLPHLRRPGGTIRVVLVTSRAGEAAPEGTADAVLYQPFSPAELAAAVARAMRAG